MGLVKKSENNWILQFFSTVASSCQKNREDKMTLTIPEELLTNVDGKPSIVFNGKYPFGKTFTEKIAKSVFQRYWDQHLFGLFPGVYYYASDGLHFDAHSKPADQGSYSILFYSNAKTLNYIGSRNPIKTTIAFQFGDAELYGLLLPLDETVGVGDLFPNQGIIALREKMQTAFEA